MITLPGAHYDLSPLQYRNPIVDGDIPCCAADIHSTVAHFPAHKTYLELEPLDFKPFYPGYGKTCSAEHITARIPDIFVVYLSLILKVNSFTFPSISLVAMDLGSSTMRFCINKIKMVLTRNYGYHKASMTFPMKKSCFMLSFKLHLKMILRPDENTF